MKVSRTGAVLAFCLFSCACAPMPPRTSGIAPGPGAPTRQILVMLRMPRPHFRPDAVYAGSYDWQSGQQARNRTARALAREHRMRILAQWPMPALRVDCFVMGVPEEDTPARLVERLSMDPRVESVQPVNLFHGLGEDDPLYPLQPSAARWHLAALHAITTGRNVRVAVIDSGVDVDHPDLQGQIRQIGNLVDGSPYVAEMHGTAVAGIIAARANDGIGIAGIAPQAKLMALRACWQDAGGGDAASCTSFTLAKALQAALDGDAQVINLSLAGPRDRLLQRLLEAGISRGVTVVAAADPQVADGGFPASVAGVVAVAGDEAPPASGNVLLAPGRDIPATAPDGGWRLVTGSSFAAAHVSGLVALLRQRAPSLQPRQLRDALAAGTRPVADRPVPIDACAAVSMVAATCACNCAHAYQARAPRLP